MEAPNEVQKQEINKKIKKRNQDDYKDFKKGNRFKSSISKRKINFQK